jgi:hypothetical protein
MFFVFKYRLLICFEVFNFLSPSADAGNKRGHSLDPLRMDRFRQSAWTGPSVIKLFTAVIYELSY